MRKTRRVLMILCLLLLAGAGLVVGQFSYILSKIGGGGGGGAISILDTIRNPEAKFPGKDRVNILLIGKDYNRDRKGMPYTKGARSDSLVLFSLDIARRRVSALSIPRDTKIPGKFSKINAAYAKGGADLSVETVGRLLGVTPDYHVALKADAIKEIVDAVGGVEVETIDEMHYDDNWGNLHIHLPRGKQVIDGEQAVGFTRYREPNRGKPTSLEDGDQRRMARQQMLIKAVVAKAKQPRYILQADKLINLVLNSVETNLEDDQMFALAAIFRHTQPDQMQTASMIGEGRMVGGTYFILPDEEKVKAQVDWLLKGDETAAYKVTLVAVQNATQVSGAARKVADLLREEGFDAQNAGNAERAEVSGELDKTRIVYTKAAVAPRAQKIAELLGGGTLVKDPQQSLSIDKQEADVTILLGRDVAQGLAQRSARL